MANSIKNGRSDSEKNRMKNYVKKLKEHDEEIFAEIIVHFTPLISTIAYNISGGLLTRSDIEEVTSDVFVTLWNNTDILRWETLKGYICCIAKSRTKDRLRKEHFKGLLDIDDTDEADDIFVDQLLEKKELSLCLREEIKKLPEQDRNILIRHYYYYQSVSQIAEIYGLNRETVKSKIRRSRIKLKKALTDRGY